MVDDARLSREAALIFQHAMGFEPDSGNLKRWRGIVNDSSGKSIELIMVIPEDFPTIPPYFVIPPDIRHPVIDGNRNIVTRTIQRWRSDYHSFQILKEVRMAFSLSPFVQGGQIVSSQNDETALVRQRDMLFSQLNEKKRLLEQMKSSPTITITQDTKKVMKEDMLVEIQNDLYALEEQFDDLEIDGLDFSRQFVELQKKYYLIMNTD
ncbi:MAG: ubiquitin-conjugating enzyme E2 [Candidatus Heimdallarchaeota archaeon]|nr:ubiquitin-conjugating enzyme E2 [Candidatus Heimdallarchaeota archaeon]MDH5646642.1 ubiquitin-conjugating enzyme E2 [Candidatus Heimdallarchaeota archaeon]